MNPVEMTSALGRSTAGATMMDVIPTPTSPADTVAPPAVAALRVVVNVAWPSTL